jgi:uncharacterized membrane protein HdeD (DUF308 family)
MLDRLVSHWWLFLIRGALLLIFGIACLAFPIAALWVIAVLFGAYAFVDGIVAIVAAFRMAHAGGRWAWLIVEGILGLVAGAIALFYPWGAALALALLMGAWAIVTGVLAIASAFDARRHVPNEWLWVLSGIVSLLFGLAVLWAPAFGLFALVWMVAFYAILGGIVFIGFAFRLRGFGGRTRMAT